jgi:hypothetical protein
MAGWTNVNIQRPEDLKLFNIELNRRIRYHLSNIDVSQILFNLNDIGGTLNLSKGGTGKNLVAPTSDSLFGYDVSTGTAVFYGIGPGLALSGTTLYNTIFGVGSTATFYKMTASTANLADISSTNSATFNVLASSSGSIGQLGSTGSITANTLTASSGNISSLQSTGQATFNALVSSSGIIGELASTGQGTFNIIVSSSASFTKLQASSAKFGNSTSYTQFEGDGTLESIGDARTFRDELGDITKLKFAGLRITEDSTDGVIIISTQGSLTDYLYTNVQLNHDRDLGSPIYPHLHWFQSSGNAPNFLMQYRWQNNGAEKIETWTDLPCNALAIAYTSGTIHQISYSTEAIHPSTGTVVSDIVQFRVIRDVANASTQFASTDDYSLPTSLLSFDVHVQTNTLGSRQQYIK